jgi:hypothetical protein
MNSNPSIFIKHTSKLFFPLFGKMMNGQPLFMDKKKILTFTAKNGIFTA